MSGTSAELPSEMDAAVYRGHKTVTVERRPVPRPGPGEVLVEVSHCGICGSDLHMMVEDWGSPGLVFGHEYSGVIAAIGTPEELKAQVGPEATLDDVFTHFTGADINEGGRFRDIARTRRTASRLG